MTTQGFSVLEYLVPPYSGGTSVLEYVPAPRNSGFSALENVADRYPDDAGYWGEVTAYIYNDRIEWVGVLAHTAIGTAAGFWPQFGTTSGMDWRMWQACGPFNDGLTTGADNSFTLITNSAVGFLSYGMPVAADIAMSCGADFHPLHLLAVVDYRVITTPSHDAVASLQENVGLGLSEDRGFVAGVYEYVTTSQPNPHIWYVFPDEANVGDTVAVVGTGFGSAQGDYSGRILFGSAVPAPVLWEQVAATSGDVIDPTTDTAMPEHDRVAFIIPLSARSADVRVSTETVI